jgi:outer membrane lipoprotein SlyB
MSISVSMFRKILNCLFLFVFILSSTGCVTTYRRGEGVVISEKKLNQMNLESGNKTVEGIKIGGTAGMVGGGVIGGAVGLIPGIMSGSSAGLVICTAVGGVIGAGLLGLTGGVLGGTVGYLGDLAVQNAPEYEFKIKQFNGSQILTIRQHSSVIPINTRVRILEKNGELFIKKIK